jgi:hypothetical protein
VVATKKQRRRRDKGRRHDYEYVYVDEEGREVEVEEAETGQPAKAEKKPAGKAIGRGGRQVQPPSWRRVFKRAGIFAPLMLIVVYLLQSKGHKSVPAALVQTLILLALFLPFSYFMDMLLWRSYQKRTGGGASQKRPNGRK